MAKDQAPLGQIYFLFITMLNPPCEWSGDRTACLMGYNVLKTTIFQTAEPPLFKCLALLLYICKILNVTLSLNTCYPIWSSFPQLSSFHQGQIWENTLMQTTVICFSAPSSSYFSHTSIQHGITQRNKKPSPKKLPYSHQIWSEMMNDSTKG